MSMETNVEHLHAIKLPTPFPVGPVTVYLGDAPGEPLTLVDTGPRTSKTLAGLEDGLASLGYRLADLDRIVVTHAHVDHFGLAGDLVVASGAEVWSHPWDVPSLEAYERDREERVAFYEALLRQAAVPGKVMEAVGWVTQAMERYGQAVAVAGTLEEGDRLRLAGRDWRVLHTPGHARGLICLYEAEGRTLLSSDHLLADISSNPVVEPRPPGHQERLRSLVLYRDSLRRVAKMQIDRALPSHGPAIEDVAGLVEQRLAFHEQRMERVREALGNGARTTWDVTQVLFPGRTPLDTFLAVSEVIGHLDLLEIEGEIEGSVVGGLVRWRRT
jgi:glyoxylase-like metal-dependent hydrolase (beta-lactamase superfamily II)